MSNDSGSIESLTSNFARWLPLLTAFGAMLAFAYEFGFCATAGISMHNALDISDLLRTSVFTIPFVSFSMAVGVVLRLTEERQDAERGEARRKSREKRNILVWWIFIIVSVIGFLDFLLLGDSGIIQIWHFGIAVVTAHLISGLPLLRDRLGANGVNYLNIFLLAVFISFIWGRNEAHSALRHWSPKTPLIKVSNEDWIMIRRYTAHIVAFDGSARLALTTRDGDEIFQWSYAKRGWRGLLCDEPPQGYFTTLSQRNCRFPWQEHDQVDQVRPPDSGENLSEEPTVSPRE